MMLTQENYDTLQWMFISKYMHSPLSTWKRFLEENHIDSKSSAPISSVKQFVENTLDEYVILDDLAEKGKYIFIPKEFAERALILGFLP